MSREIQVSFPIVEPVVTPRAREGLRTVVPTIYPPSTVNRGESVCVRPPEPERKPRSHALPAQRVLDSGQAPKKRGPKPKLRFSVSGPSSRSSAEIVQRNANEQFYFAPSKMRGTSDCRVFQSTQKFQAEAFRASKQFGSGLSSCGASSSNWPTTGHGILRHGTNQYSSLSDPHVRRKHVSKNSLFQSDNHSSQKCPASHNPEGEAEEAWIPCLNNVEKVTVTDVTSNSLTVTIKESSTDQGFFKDKK